MPSDTENQINALKQQLESLTAEFYKNNFSSSQDFNKKVRMNTAFRAPVYASPPATCELGEVYVNSGTGKAYVCSSANNWTIIGTQTA